MISNLEASGTLDRLLAVRPSPPSPPSTRKTSRWATILGSGVHLGNAATYLIPHTTLASTTDRIQLWARRKQFIDLLRSSPDRNKVRVFYLTDPTTGIHSPHTYVHTKMYAALWLSPPPGARVARYGRNAGVDPGWHRRISWDRIFDPCLPTPGHPC